MQSKQTACQRLTHIDGGVGDDPAKVGEDVRREEVRVDLVPQAVRLPESKTNKFRFTSRPFPGHFRQALKSHCEG